MAVANVMLAIDCSDKDRLVQFYAGLFDVEVHDDTVVTPQGLMIWFQQIDGYQGPTWPTQERGQQMHLDIQVDDVQTMVQKAIDLGAHKAESQPDEESFTVMLDPDGHPFCLFTGE